MNNSNFQVLSKAKCTSMLICEDLGLPDKTVQARSHRKDGFLLATEVKILVTITAFSKRF